MWNHLFNHSHVSFCCTVFNVFFLGHTASQRAQEQNGVSRQQDGWNHSPMLPKHQAAKQLVSIPSRCSIFLEKIVEISGPWLQREELLIFHSKVTAAPLGALPWRCSRPGCLCGDWPKMSCRDTLQKSMGNIRSRGATAQRLAMLKTEALAGLTHRKWSLCWVG